MTVTLRWIREAALWVGVKLKESVLNVVLSGPMELGLEQLLHWLLARKHKRVFSTLIKLATLTSLVSFYQVPPPLTTPNYIRLFPVTMAASPLFFLVVLVFSSSDS